MNKVALNIEHLSAGFGENDQLAIQDISFQVDHGQCLAVVGESGSGKSVTSLHAMGLLPMPPAFIREGKIQFDGQSVLDLDLEERRKLRGKSMAMVFQEPMSSLNPVLKCGFQVEEMLSEHEEISKKEAQEKVLKLFAQVKLPDPKRAFDSYPHELSGGQKQRVMIAMAIACKPALLIADEPTTALDVTVQKEIILLLKDLQQHHNMALLFITHDLGVVAEIADQVVVMRKGQVVEQGDVQTILSNPTHPYTRGLIACRPPWDSRPHRLPTVQQFLGEVPPVDATLTSAHDRLRMLNSMQQKTPLLEVDGLTKTYISGKGKGKHVVHAIKDVTFNVFPGETLGLVGESGCGKTTLSRCLLRLIEPTQGSAHFDGESIANMDSAKLRSFRKSAQLIFQDPFASLNPRMTIENALMEVMRVHGIDQPKKRALELMDEVGLPADSLQRYPHEFSGGQRQRIVIARALALRPKFIICDESVSALDVSVQAQVLNLLNDLKEKYGLTYIFISHDLSVVRYMSDRILVMNQGLVEEFGEADKLCTTPQSAYTKKLINSIPGH